MNSLTIEQAIATYGNLSTEEKSFIVRQGESYLELLPNDKWRVTTPGNKYKSSGVLISIPTPSDDEYWVDAVKELDTAFNELMTEWVSIKESLAI